MTQIQRGGEMDGRRVEKLVGTLQKAAYGSPSPKTPPPLHAWSLRSHPPQFSGLLLLCQIKHIKPVQESMQLLSWFCMFIQPLDSFTCMFLHGHSPCVCSHLFCTRVVSLRRTRCTLHEILRSEDGDVCVPGLAGDVSWSSVGQCTLVMVVWPTHSLLPCCPPPYLAPHRRPPCFPTEQMTFMPETISPPDCRKGSIL